MEQEIDNLSFLFVMSECMCLLTWLDESISSNYLQVHYA